MSIMSGQLSELWFLFRLWYCRCVLDNVNDMAWISVGTGITRQRDIKGSGTGGWVFGFTLGGTVVDGKRGMQGVEGMVGWGVV